MPFGDRWIDQQNGYDSRYTFSAKEKDDETQYTYFGMRYYDSDLSIWLSVDPMSDQRPGISPYNYCQWNPVMRTDPTGALDGDYLGLDGKYLGSDGETDKKVYIVNTNKATLSKEECLRWKKVYEGTGTSSEKNQIALNGMASVSKSKITLLSLNRDQLLDRARWIYGEGGSAEIKEGGAVADYYAWAVHNLREKFKSEEAMMKSAMVSKENGAYINNYNSFKNGTFNHPPYPDFWKAQQGGFSTLYSVLPKSQSVISSIIKTETNTSIDPTNGAYQWLGGGAPNRVNRTGESYPNSVRIQTKDGYFHYFYKPR